MEGVVIIGGKMRFTDANRKLITHVGTTSYFKNVHSQMEFGNDEAIASDDWYGLLYRHIDRRNTLILRANSTGMQWSKLEDGVLATIGSVSSFPSSLLADTNYWLVGTANEAVLDGALWESDPRAGGSPMTTVSHTLTTPEAAVFNIDSAQIGTGLFVELATNFDDGWIDSWSYQGLEVSGIAAVLVNDGNFPTQPIFELTGQMVNPIIVNTTTGERLIINGEIPAGSRWLVDIAKHTILDENKVNKFDMLDDLSDWPELMPGRNQIQIQTVGSDSHSALRIFYRHAWI